MVRTSTVLIGAAASGLVGAQAADERRRGIANRTTAAIPTITTMANAKRQVALPTDINPLTLIPTNLVPGSVLPQLMSDGASFATGTASTYATAICTSNRPFPEVCVNVGCTKTPRAFTAGPVVTTVPFPTCDYNVGSRANVTQGAPSGTRSAPTGTAQPTANAAPGRGLPLYGLRLPRKRHGRK